MSSKTALIIRATGTQGKGTIKSLLATGWKVHAFVNDASTDRAQALKKLGDGVSLYQGTLEDGSSIEAAAKGCRAAFFTQMPDFTQADPVAHEVQQARTFVEVAKSAGIKHVVFSTQLGLFDPEIHLKKEWTETILRPAIIGKYEVEKIIRDSGIGWTILRPGWFMTNLLPPSLDFFAPGSKEGKLTVSYRPEGVLGAVDPDDIGEFVAAAFNLPEKFLGKHVPVASEYLTTTEVFDQFIQATGKPLRVHYRSKEENEIETARNPFILGQTLTHGLEKLTTMEEIRSWGVPLTPFSEFLKKHKEELATI
ncbi:NAD(P)-binding protein [Periconia macrospinosa]|uniref:NAD(P)-binding protein n=1 Tax=Periconia macrospinosa TaxID=97972 RepID=A0A2V1E9Z0_9PLEO|nr:NAD(P)-binding protein [Periconia macrospinosa]